MSIKNKLIKTSFSVAMVTIVAKIIGFLRNVVVASAYGESWQIDAFFFAESLPGMLFPSVCMSLATAFVPLYINRNGTEERKRFAACCLRGTTYLAIGLGVIGAFVSGRVVPLLVPGFFSTQTELTIKLSQITMSMLFLLMIQYMLIAVLNANSVFYYPLLARMACNITVITMILLFWRQNSSIFVLMWATVIGQFIMILVLIVPSRVYIKHDRIDHKSEKPVIELIKLSLPIMLGNGVLAVNSMIDRYLASGFSEGSISALSYSDTITQLVMGVIIVPVTTVLYPVISSAYAEGNTKEYLNNVKRGRDLLFFTIMPISVILSIGAGQIIGILYERGSFTIDATKRTAELLAIYAIGYAFLGVREIYARAFYAEGNSVIPMRNSMIGIVTNCICSICMSRILGLRGIAVGTLVSNVIIAALMIRSFWKENDSKNTLDLVETTKVLIAGTITYLLLYSIGEKLSVNSAFFSLVFKGSAIVLCYYLTAIILKSEIAVFYSKLILMKVKKVLKEV